MWWNYRLKISSYSSPLFFLVFSIFFHWVRGIQYGPSLDFLIPFGQGSSSSSRKEIHLDGFYPTYSVTLPLANNSVTGHVLTTHPQGEFSILAPTDWGIMVVIQSLRLRTMWGFSTTDDNNFIKCRDWIRFNDGNHTSQVCGQVMKYSKDAVPQGLLGPRTFITSLSQLTVSLWVDREQVLLSGQGQGQYQSQGQGQDYGWHEPIAVELVVTAFKQCPKRSLVSQWRKWTGSNPLRSCSPSEDRVCIHSATFCDGLGNCAVKGPLGHIGYDEEGCGPYQYQPQPQDKVVPLPPTPPTPVPEEGSTTTRTAYIGVGKPYTPPTVGKVISPIHLIFIFSIVVLILFAGCTWLAKANEKKFQHTVYRFSTIRRQRRNDRAAAAASNSTSAARARVEIPSEDDEPGAATINRRPSAPPVNTFGDVEIGGGEEPPPYHHLFPSAPPLTATPTPPSHS